MKFKVWIGSLGAYNWGILVGKWVDPLNEDLKEVVKQVNAEGSEKAGEDVGDEYGVFDYLFEPESIEEQLILEDFENVFKIDEYAGLRELEKLAEFLDEADAWELAKVAYYLEDTGETILKAPEHKYEAQDVEVYLNMTLREVAMEAVEDGWISEDQLLRYIDYEKAKRDWSAEVYEVPRVGVFVYS